MTNQQKFDRLRKLLDEASVYARAVGKLEFDMQCCAPKDGMEQAGADMAVLSDRHFRLTHTKRYAQLVTELHADSEELTPVQKKVVEHLYEAWEKEKNIPAKLNYEMSLAYNRAYSKWLEAKQAADFSLFRDSLAEIISYTHKALDLRENKKPTYYDALLDDTERAAVSPSSTRFLTRCARGSSRWCGAFRRRASPSARISCPARAPFRSRRRSPDTCWSWRA